MTRLQPDTTSKGARRSRLAPLLLISAVVATALTCGFGLAQADAEAEAAYADGPVIEIAFCLDISDSMGPSIDAARDHLWAVVEDLTSLEPMPVIRVALLTYGGNRNPRATGFIRTEQSLTADLDAVHESLLALETKGSVEFVGRVIRSAVSGLTWADGEDVVRMVFVIGNEPADQDPELSLAQLADEAADRDIAIHPIFVGREDEEGFVSWRRLAEFAGVEPGRIVASKAASLRASPFDKQLASLGERLDATIVPFAGGSPETGDTDSGPAEAQQQSEPLDPAVEASRAVAKAEMIGQGSGDLVSAADSGQIDPWEISAERVPVELRSMEPSELATHLFELAEERAELVEQIDRLGRQRSEFLAASDVPAGNSGTEGDLSRIIITAVRERAGERGMR